MRTTGRAGPAPEALLFSATRAAGDHDLGLGLAAPLGLFLHAVAIGAVALFSLTVTVPPPAPVAVPAKILQLAPPPPLAYRYGAPATEQASSVEPVDVAVRLSHEPPRRPNPSRPVALLSVEALEAHVALPEGIPEGLEDGSVDGMDLGLEGGVVGGVPGGITGGVIGGAGTAIPEFPEPDVGPRPIRMPRARYTEEAIRHNVTGAVKLRAVIDEKGKVQVLEVTQSIPELDAVAIRTVETSWLFRPATRNGRPVPCVSRLEVNFNLR